MHIRTATIADLEQVAGLFDAYRQFYGQASDTGLANQFLKERMVNEQSIILLAEGAEGQVMGFVQLYPSFSSVSAAATFILNDLFVSPQHRREGVARALLLAARDMARARGAIRLSLSTATDNANAQALYESLGWVRDTQFYHYGWQC